MTKKERKSKPLTYINDDFKAKLDFRRYVFHELGESNFKVEEMKFMAYWTDLRENKLDRGKKRNWDITYLNWMKSAVDNNKKRNINTKEMYKIASDKTDEKLRSIQVSEEQKKKGMARIEELKRQARGR